MPAVLLRLPGLDQLRMRFGQADPTHAAIWRLYANTGMRRMEGLNLKRTWVGREELRILSCEGERTKSGKWRSIPLMARKPNPIDVLDGPKIVLAGRIVTMDAAFSVLANGRLYIDKGAIVAVQEGSAPAPSGFANAKVIDTAGTIYPGLIELHNHLAYNALQLWDVPKRYGNRDQWAGIPEYRKRISGPMKIIGVTPGLLPALIGGYRTSTRSAAPIRDHRWNATSQPLSDGFTERLLQVHRDVDQSASRLEERCLRSYANMPDEHDGIVRLRRTIRARSMRA